MPTLLALRPLGLGDFLTGIPAYRGLARAFPEHHRSLAAPKALHELVPFARAFDDALDVAPLAPLPPIAELDVAVDLHGRGPASQRILLAARPRRIVAFANPLVPETRGGAVWRAGEREIVRWGRMLRTAGVAVDDTDLDILAPRTTIGLRFAGAVVVHPGAASEARRWPVERYAHVAKTLRRRGTTVVVTGASRDRERAHALASLAAIPASHVVAGRTSLVDLASIVGAARGVVCGDTGIAHLATATRTPSVVLFGPVSPAEWGPPSDRPMHRALWTGKRGSPHGTAVDAGLLEIGTADVLGAIDAAFG